MKVVHISTSDKGGAGIAATRLHIQLLKVGIDSHMLTKYRLGSPIKNRSVYSDSIKVPFSSRIIKSAMHRLNIYKSVEERISKKHLKNRPTGFEYFSFPFSDYQIEKHPLIQETDIIHLHWVSENFLNFPSFFKAVKKKIVWTLHDMNAFTGGCHHADACTKFLDDCKICPQLQNTIDENYAFKMQSLKENIFQKFTDNQIKIVAPSSWLKEKSSSSKLFRRFQHFTIPNGIDKTIFFPHNKTESRNKLKLPSEKKILLYVSNEVDNKRKGIDFLKEAISKLQGEDIALCTIGKNASEFQTTAPQINLGFITDDETLALAYSAADVFVLPSLAENFPNTSCESLFCGTPVVAFRVGGLPEQINSSNGILVDKINAEDLATAIQSILDSPQNFSSQKINIEAQKLFNINSAAEKYIELYKSF